MWNDLLEYQHGYWERAPYWGKCSGPVSLVTRDRKARANMCLKVRCLDPSFEQQSFCSCRDVPKDSYFEFRSQIHINHWFFIFEHCCHFLKNSIEMPSFSNSGRDDPNDLQQAIHGLVAEFFEMLGDGEAGSLTMLFFVYIYILVGLKMEQRIVCPKMIHSVRGCSYSDKPKYIFLCTHIICK